MHNETPHKGVFKCFAFGFTGIAFLIGPWNKQSALLEQENFGECHGGGTQPQTLTWFG